MLALRLRSPFTTLATQRVLSPACPAHCAARRYYNRPAHSPHASPSELQLRRSWLYVPSSSDKMLAKSKEVGSDMVIYDLEDSVSPVPADKERARVRLQSFLEHEERTLDRRRVAVRVNSVSTKFFEEDMAYVLRSPVVSTLVLPKVNSTKDLNHVSNVIRELTRVDPGRGLRLVASIESAQALWNIGSISHWKSEHGPLMGGQLSALLFAAEDFCADTGIIRTHSRRELLYTRSQIVIAAKAHGIEAIDMVFKHYKDPEELKEECKDGRNLGFNGKQAIHPVQVETIQSTFVPTEQEILRAAKIVHQLDAAYASTMGTGAVGIDGEMIDAPMLKQAEKVISMAKAAGLTIPHV
ncbi:Pyruvate/Phosphoenolpyruvate kinase-like domain-containing protein [Schizophyllum commune]